MTVGASDGASVAADAALSGAVHPRRMRVVYCTRGGLFGALVLHRLRAYPQIEICGIVRSSLNYQRQFGFLQGALAYVRRSGIVYSLYLLCATDVADAVCRLSSIGCVPTRSRRWGMPVHTTRDVNDPRGLQFLTDCAPDLLVSAFFDQRLREAALAIPILACVNIHPSLLPSFKGVDPVLQARVQQAGVGVTVHYMTPQLDAGEILVQHPITLREGASIFETTAALFREGANLLITQMGRLERRERGTPQDTPGSYQGWPGHTEVRALRKLGVALIRLSDFRRLMKASSSDL